MWEFYIDLHCLDSDSQTNNSYSSSDRGSVLILLQQHAAQLTLIRRSLSHSQTLFRVAIHD